MKFIKFTLSCFVVCSFYLGCDCKPEVRKTELFADTVNNFLLSRDANVEIRFMYADGECRYYRVNYYRDNVNYETFYYCQCDNGKTCSISFK